MADGHVIIDTELDQSGLKSGLASLGTNLVSGITKAVTAAGTALAGLGAYSIKVGSDFEYAISGVAATMGTTVDQIEQISTKAKQLGATTKFTATEAADGFNILAQAGLSLDEQMSSIDATLSLAAAGEMSMDNAAGYLTTTIKAMSASTREANLSMDDASRVADLYAKGAVLAKTSTAEFGDAMSKSAAMAGSYNQSLETTGSALLALAEGGYTGSAAGTYLSRAMADLYAPTSNAQKALSALGVSAYDESGKAKDLIDVVDELEGAMSGMTEEQKNATAAQIFTSAGLKAYNTIVSQGTDKLRGFSKELKNSAGAAQQMAETKLDNLKGDITILQSATEGFGIAFYESMSNVGEGTGMMRDFVQEATEIMGELTDAVNEGGFDGLVDALGGALSKAVNKIVEYVPMIIEGGTKIVSGLVQGLTASAVNIANSVTSITSALVGGIISITDDLIALGSELIIALCQGLSENSADIITSISKGLMSISATIVNYFPKILEAGAELLKALADGILENLPALIESLGAVLRILFSSLTDSIPEIISCIGKIITSIVEALPSLVSSIVEFLPSLLNTVIEGIIESSEALLSAVSDVVMAIVDALPDIIVSLIEVLPTLIQSICDGLMQFIPMVIDAGVQLLTALVQALPTVINTIALSLPSLVHGIVEGLLNLLPFIVDCGVQLFVALVQALPDIIYAIVAVLPVIIDSVISTLVSLIPLLIECGIKLFTALVSAMPQIIAAIVCVIPQIIDSLISAFLDNLPLIIQCGIDLITSIISDLPSIITAIVMHIPTIIAALVKAFIDNVPKIIAAGIQLLCSLVKAIPNCISTLRANIPKIISAIVNSFRAGFSQIKEVGSNLISGLWNGMGNKVQWLIGKIKGLCSDALGSIKSFFGIKSPSTLMRDVVGKNLMLGWSVGIDKNADVVTSSLADVAEAVAKTDFDFDFGKGIEDITATADISYLEHMVKSDKQRTVDVIGSKADGITYSSSKDSSESLNSSKNDKPKCVVTVLNIDGKEFARAETPYIEKELNWRNKK